MLFDDWLAHAQRVHPAANSLDGLRHRPVLSLFLIGRLHGQYKCIAWRRAQVVADSISVANCAAELRRLLGGDSFYLDPSGIIRRVGLADVAVADAGLGECFLEPLDGGVGIAI